MFGTRRVGFVKLKADSSFVVDGIKQPDKLPGITMLLRGNAVAVVVALHCEGGNGVQIILVEQARVPIGIVSCLELPAGMLDDEKDTMTGTAVKELEEDCDFKLKPSELKGT